MCGFPDSSAAALQLHSLARVPFPSLIRVQTDERKKRERVHSFSLSFACATSRLRTCLSPTLSFFYYLKFCLGFFHWYLLRTYTHTHTYTESNQPVCLCVCVCEACELAASTRKYIVELCSVASTGLVRFVYEYISEKNFSWDRVIESRETVRKKTRVNECVPDAVSYTHLTLPTIYSV